MNKNIFNVTIKTLFCFFVLVNTPVYVMENNNQTLSQKGIIDNSLAVIATSRVMHHLNQFFAKRIPLQGIPASEEAQILGKEAQVAVGIPAERQVPIQYVPELGGAAAEINAIIVGNEFAHEEVAYGVKRCDMFHEAVHIKYHDKAFNMVLFSCPFLGMPLAIKMFVKPQGKLKLLYLPVSLASNYLGRFIQGRFKSYRERRADIEGHYATKCYKCVTEKIENTRNTYELANDIITRLDHNTDLNEVQVNGLAFAKSWVEDKKFYLSIEENETIAAELKRDNKICAFHEQSEELL